MSILSQISGATRRLASLLTRFPLSGAVNAERWYRQQGEGLRARGQEFAAEWSGHHGICKELQRAAVAGQSYKRAAVLGAGSLLDVDLEAICHAAEAVSLIDVDPHCFASLKGVQQSDKKNKVDFSCLDLGGFAQLTELLRGRGATAYEECCRTVSEKVRESSAVALGSADLVLSQNLLGQVGLFLRDRFIAQFYQQVRESPEKLATVLAEIQRHHLKVIRGLKPKTVVIVSDDLTSSCHQDGQPFDSSNLLFIDLERELAADFKVVQRRTWLWPLLPAGKGGVAGEVHTMVGLVLETGRNAR